jgi:tetratricopeptide (TPR) repeat protein
VFVCSLPLVLALLAPPPAVDRAAAVRTMNEGVALTRRNDWTGAETALRRASELDPGLPHTWLNLGHVYRKTERLEEAARALRSGLAVSDGSVPPMKVELQAQLGRTLLEQARAPESSHADRTAKAREAVELLQAATAAEPHRVRALLRLAEAYELLDQPEQADAVYRHAIAADPMYSPAYGGLAALYVAHGFAELAVQILQEDIKRNPQRADSWVGLGHAYAALGDHVQAIEAFDKAIEIDPDDPAPRFGLGLAHAELRHRKAAVEALEGFLARVATDTPQAAARAKLANDMLARLQDSL